MLKEFKLGNSNFDNTPGSLFTVKNLIKALVNSLQDNKYSSNYKLNFLHINIKIKINNLTNLSILISQFEKILTNSDKITSEQKKIFYGNKGLVEVRITY